MDQDVRIEDGVDPQELEFTLRAERREEALHRLRLARARRASRRRWLTVPPALQDGAEGDRSAARPSGATA